MAFDRSHRAPPCHSFRYLNTPPRHLSLSVHSWPSQTPVLHSLYHDKQRWSGFTVSTARCAMAASLIENGLAPAVEEVPAVPGIKDFDQGGEPLLCKCGKDIRLWCLYHSYLVYPPARFLNKFCLVATTTARWKHANNIAPGCSHLSGSG